MGYAMISVCCSPIQAMYADREFGQGRCLLVAVQKNLHHRVQVADVEHAAPVRRRTLDVRPRVLPSADGEGVSLLQPLFACMRILDAAQCRVCRNLGRSP